MISGFHFDLSTGLSILYMHLVLCGSASAYVLCGSASAYAQYMPMPNSPHIGSTQSLCILWLRICIHIHIRPIYGHAASSTYRVILYAPYVAIPHFPHIRSTQSLCILRLRICIHPFCGHAASSAYRVNPVPIYLVAPHLHTCACTPCVTRIALSQSLIRTLACTAMVAAALNPFYAWDLALWPMLRQPLASGRLRRWQRLQTLRSLGIWHSGQCCGGPLASGRLRRLGVLCVLCTCRRRTC